MAFFKIRKGGSDPVAAAAATPAESVEALRRRARQRLIGAAVLVLAGIIGFPLVFDSQPRPIAVDIPIEIPDRAKARPASAPAAVTTAGATGAVVASAEPAPATASAPSPGVVPASAPASAPGPAPAFVPAAVQVPAPAPAPAVSAIASAAPRAASAPQAAEGRFVVQVGAFADPAKAQAVRQTLEKAGLKTYIHVAETKEGKRTRVRVGPFATRAEADQMAAKVKGLSLQASVLTL